MANMKFGLKQVTNATPALIGRLRKLMLYVMGGVGVFITPISKMVNVPVSDLIEYGGMAVFALTGLAEFFGVPLDDATVPTKDVTEVETT